MAEVFCSSIIEYLAYAHAIIASFGRKGVSVSKIKDYVNLTA